MFAFLAACSSSSGPTVIEHTFDPCSPLHVEAPGASTEQAASIDAGAALWGGLGLKAPTRALAPDAPSLTIMFQSAPAPYFGQYDDKNEIIYINTGLVDPNERAITIAHELGHAFGLLHVPPDERSSVMNPGNLTIAPNAGDLGKLESLWGACMN